VAIIQNKKIKVKSMSNLCQIRYGKQAPLLSVNNDKELELLKISQSRLYAAGKKEVIGQAKTRVEYI